jgi:hypothetical protein
VTPYILTLKNGEKVRADLLVKDFGLMLVATEEAEETFRRLDHQIVAAGYGYSVCFGEDLDYDRERFIDTLKDWGWTGAANQRPAWATKETK